MPDHPIAPDLTGDVPRCSRECPSHRQPSAGDAPWCAVDSSRSPAHHSICLPHVRHLKVLSERRCDGCASWTRSIEYTRSGWCRYVNSGDGPDWAEDDYCSGWEPRQTKPPPR